MNEKIEKRFANVGKSVTFRNIVETFDLGTKPVLDIGCSYGEFTAKFGKGSTGITISEEEAVYGTSKGLDVRYGNIESDSFDLNAEYDALFANNLFEHLYSPHHFLCKIKKYLKPNGILILGVPCIPKLTSLLHLRKFRGSLAVSHINFFTRDTLIKTVERGGWKLITARGFHFKNKIVDHILDPIYPHMYIVATMDSDFEYADKRKRELMGYNDVYTNN